LPKGKSIETESRLVAPWDWWLGREINHKWALRNFLWKDLKAMVTQLCMYSSPQITELYLPRLQRHMTSKIPNPQNLFSILISLNLSTALDRRQACLPPGHTFFTGFLPQ
jgi:hypothetical protein